MLYVHWRKHGDWHDAQSRPKCTWGSVSRCENRSQLLHPLFDYHIIKVYNRLVSLELLVCSSEPVRCSRRSHTVALNSTFASRPRPLFAVPLKSHVKWKGGFYWSVISKCSVSCILGSGCQTSSYWWSFAQLSALHRTTLDHSQARWQLSHQVIKLNRLRQIRCVK